VSNLANAIANGYVFPTQAGAAACASEVDSTVGYPKPGINVGGGTHVPPAQSVTQTYFVPIQNAANALQWAYIADSVTMPIVAPNAVSLNLPAPTAIAVTWYP